MANQSDALLTTEANVIQNETTAGANTATRVGTMINDLIDSKINNDKIATSTALSGGDTVVPSALAVKTYVDNAVNFKAYRIYITQSGSSAPTATVLGNTLSGTPVLTRSSAGEYLITLAAAFPAAKTFISNKLRLLPFLTTTFNQIVIQRVSDNAIGISTSTGTNGGGSPNDGVLSSTDIEIIVYN